MAHGKICYLEIPAKTAEASKQIQAKGGRVTKPRTEIGQGMGAFAFFTDPVGNEFGLYEERSR
jgi:predicted enzyme related to lactoylglutathione lyase